MSIWNKPATLAQLNQFNKNTLAEHLAIEITELGDDTLVGTMSVDSKTHQPMGLLHGGASIALAETLGSMAGYLAAAEGMVVVGQQVSANHLRSVTSGEVTGVAFAIHLGRTSQLWQIDVEDEHQRLCCSVRLTLAVIPEPT
ncbi:hotdog fold thioesterase [Corallincola platygyrae]|uniref:Hotdog fold thioesterase n=1 Tax=Corallincola platygyrae TaxID=1193278 RepID=A0ABW4XKZ7_9GAMM